MQVIPPSRNTGTPSDLIALNVLPQTYVRMGLTTGIANRPPHDRLSTDSLNYCFITGVAKTEVGALPLFSKEHTYFTSAYNSYIESAVWTLDAERNLVAQWVNPDGSKVMPLTHYRALQGPKLRSQEHVCSSRIFWASQRTQLSIQNLCPYQIADLACILCGEI